MSYTQGTMIRVRARFHDLNNQLADPDDVVYTIIPPTEDQIIRVYSSPDTSIIRESKGRYYSDIDTSSESGRWRYQVEGEGDGIALLPVVEIREIRVNPNLS